jgi:hypothetical protein
LWAWDNPDPDARNVEPRFASLRQAVRAILERALCQNIKMGSGGTKQPLASTVVASTDPLAYVAALLWGFVIVCTAALVIYALATGEALKQSWSEIVLGVSVISLGWYWLIRYRAWKIARLLETGERSTALVEAYRAMDQWVWVTLAFEHRGRAVTKRVLLAASERTRALAERETVTIATDPEAPKRLVISDFFEC